MKGKTSSWLLGLGIFYWILATVALVWGLIEPDHWLLWVEVCVCGAVAIILFMEWRIFKADGR